MTSSPRRARARLLVSCLVALASSSLACSDTADAKTAKKDEQGLKKREPARVRVAAVEQREMVSTISATTTVQSEKEVKILPRTSGVVVAMKVEEGDAVEEGAVLAELDARDKDAQLEEARVSVLEAEDAIKRNAIMEREAGAKVASAKLGYDQAVRDFDRNEKANLISQSALDGLRLARDTRQSDWESAKLAHERSQADAKASETTLQKARLALQTRELERTYTQITAPFSGVIAQRSIKFGDSVGTSTTAFVLTDAQNLRAILHRPQKELDLFAQAMKRKGDGASRALEIRARAEAMPGLAFKGEIQRVSPSIDSESGSFRVTIRLEPASIDAPEKKLLPGMLVRVEVVTDRHPDALVVPKRALRHEGEADLLFVARDGHARRVEVQEGFSEDLDVEVLPKQGELVAGDAVVVVGNRELEDGAEVEIEAEKPATTQPAQPVEPASTEPKPEEPKKG